MELLQKAMAEATDHDMYQESKAEITDTHSSDIMYVLNFGRSYKYTIPGFSVIAVQLRHAKIQKISRSGEVKLFDVFFNEEITSEMHPLTSVEVIESCFVEVRCYIK